MWKNVAVNFKLFLRELKRIVCFAQTPTLWLLHIHPSLVSLLSLPARKGQGRSSIVKSEKQSRVFFWLRSSSSPWQRGSGSKGTKEKQDCIRTTDERSCYHTNGTWRDVNDRHGYRENVRCLLRYMYRVTRSINRWTDAIMALVLNPFPATHLSTSFTNPFIHLFPSCTTVDWVNYPALLKINEWRRNTMNGLRDTGFRRNGGWRRCPEGILAVSARSWRASSHVRTANEFPANWMSSERCTLQDCVSSSVIR